jgi:Ca2+/H+ antiporter
MTKDFQQSASRILILAGIVSTAVGLFTLFYPPSGDSTAWGYPFPPGTHVVVSIVLVITHLLKAYGFVGLSRLDGAAQVTRWSLIVAILGFVVVAVCEGISAKLVGVPIDSPAAVNLNNGYGVGSMLLAIPSMIGGIAIIRRRLLDGFGRWSVFLSGAFMVFVVTPALFTGRAWPAYLALTGWSLFYIWIGTALGRTARS